MSDNTKRRHGWGKPVFVLTLLAVPITGGWSQGANGALTGCQSAHSAADRIAACHELLRLDPSNVRALYNLGLALTLSRQYAPAESAWTRYAELQPRQFAGHYNLGLMLEFQKHYDRALGAFQSALLNAESSQQQQTSCFHIGVVQYNLHRPNTALRWLRAAVALDTTDLSAWSAAAIVAEGLRRDSEAVSYWARVAQGDPTFPRALSAKERADYEASLRRVGKQPPASIEPKESCRETGGRGR